MNYKDREYRNWNEFPAYLRQAKDYLLKTVEDEVKKLTQLSSTRNWRARQEKKLTKRQKNM